MLPRRALLIGGVASAALLAGGRLTAVSEDQPPRQPRAHERLAGCQVDAAAPDAGTAQVRRGSFASARRKRRVHWVLLTPRGIPRRELSLVLVLHGKGGSAASCVDDLAYHRYLAAQTGAAGAALALAAVDGGNQYWHPRVDGDDPLGMLLDEFLPRLEDAGLSTARIGVTGWSMGGYAALLLARESERELIGGIRVVAAAASSPALYPSFEATRRGAFDSADDFAVWGNLLDDPGVRAPEQGGTGLRVDCGEADAFQSVTRAYRDAVPAQPAGGITAGCHDRAYWRSIAPAQLAWLGDTLTGTHPPPN